MREGPSSLTEDDIILPLASRFDENSMVLGNAATPVIGSGSRLNIPGRSLLALVSVIFPEDVEPGSESGGFVGGRRKALLVLSAVRFWNGRLNCCCISSKFLDMMCRDVCEEEVAAAPFCCNLNTSRSCRSSLVAMPSRLGILLVLKLEMIIMSC